MKISSIISIIFGLFLIVIAIELFLNIPLCKDDTEVLLFVIMMVCSGFGGACLIAAGIADWNKSK